MDRDLSWHDEAVPVDEIGHGHHACGVFRSDAERQEVAVDYVSRGLRSGDRLWYVADTPSTGQAVEWLRAGGLDVDDALTSGQLAVLLAEEFFAAGAGRPAERPARRPGDRGPGGRPAERLRRAIDRALADGYAGLRVAAEMSWAAPETRWAQRSVQLSEFERAAGHLVRSRPIACLCSYDRRLFGVDRLGSLVALHTALCGDAS
jgi:hypothetical protein